MPHCCAEAQKVKVYLVNALLTWALEMYVRIVKERLKMRRSEEGRRGFGIHCVERERYCGKDVV